jgi:hypothetical protein
VGLFLYKAEFCFWHGLITKYKNIIFIKHLIVIILPVIFTGVKQGRSHRGRNVGMKVFEKNIWA